MQFLIKYECKITKPYIKWACFVWSWPGHLIHEVFNLCMLCTFVIYPTFFALLLNLQKLLSAVKMHPSLAEKAHLHHLISQLVSYKRYHLLEDFNSSIQFKRLLMKKFLIEQRNWYYFIQHSSVIWLIDNEELSTWSFQPVFWLLDLLALIFSWVLRPQ